MNDFSLSKPDWTGQTRSRSMGIKLIVLCGLALLMTIPSFFVDQLVHDRTQRAAEVFREISGHVGGPQTFLGPTLAIPYTVPPSKPLDSVEHGVYLVFPAQASASLNTTTEERHRSLFRVPVFQADIAMDANFDLTGVPALAPRGAALEWSKAEIIVGVSDARGALADATLTTSSRTQSGGTYTLLPAETLDHLALKTEEKLEAPLALFGAKVGGIARPDTSFQATSRLRFSGAERIAVLAYGKTTKLSAEGDWRSPGFDGGILPVSRTISNNGFAAKWSVPFLARGVRAEGPSDSMTGLSATALGVSFIELADPYQSVNRSLKYVLLFLSLLFLSYFIFEVTTGRRVHPAQYVLVGIAQIIFYLLLLSLAERIGFDAGFAIAGTATVALLSLNAGWIFASRLQGMKAMATFTVSYGLIYVLLRLEDNALLVGAVASFAVVSAVMYLTRRINWYSSLTTAANPE